MTDISNCPVVNPRFPYGKWNNTSTNLKLYAPLPIMHVTMVIPSLLSFSNGSNNNIFVLILPIK